MADASYPQKSRLGWAGVWEQIYPFVLGLIAAAAWMIFGSNVVCYAQQHNWHLDQLYTAVFAFLAITTGFLATFYCTIQCMSEGFIQRIRNTQTLNGFLAFTKHAIIIGFIVSIVSVPMMVVTPMPITSFSWSAVIVALWLGVAVYAVASFYRVASLFFFLFEARLDRGNPAH
jgi:hypothetical protein